MREILAILKAMQQFVLEKYRLFPYVAWTLIICFTLFTAHLALTLQKETAALQAQFEQY